MRRSESAAVVRRHREATVSRDLPGSHARRWCTAPRARASTSARFAQRARRLRDRCHDHHDARPRRQALRDDRQLLHLGVAERRRWCCGAASLYAQSLPAFQEGLAFRRQHLGLRPDRAVEQIRHARSDDKFADDRPHHPGMRRPGHRSARRRISSAATSIRHYGGDHIIFIGHVERFAYTRQADPYCSAAANTCAASRSCRADARWRGRHDRRCRARHHGRRRSPAT